MREVRSNVLSVSAVTMSDSVLRRGKATTGLIVLTSLFPTATEAASLAVRTVSLPEALTNV